MRHIIMYSLFPAAVALMLSLGIVMTVTAETTESGETPEGASRVDTDAVTRIALASSAAGRQVFAPASTSASPAPAAACRRVAAATDPADGLVERCRAWLESHAERAADGGVALCRRIMDAKLVAGSDSAGGQDSEAPSLVERCRAVLAELAPVRPSEAPRGESRRDWRGGGPARDLSSTIR